MPRRALLTSFLTLLFTPAHSSAQQISPASASPEALKKMSLEELSES